MAKAEVQRLVGACDWFVFLVWELSVPPGAVSQLGDFGTSWCLRLLPCNRTALVSRQESFSTFLLSRDCPCLSVPSILWASGWPQFSGQPCGGSRHCSHWLCRVMKRNPRELSSAECSSFYLVTLLPSSWNSSNISLRLWCVTSNFFLLLFPYQSCFVYFLSFRNF